MKIRYLVVDTETNGLPKDWDAPASDVANWPRIVQIAWREGEWPRENPDGPAAESHIVRPDGWRVTPASTKIHGISHRRAIREGVSIEDALRRFIAAAWEADLLVGHNVLFDLRVILAEMARLGWRHSPDSVAVTCCTMREGAQVCQIPDGKGGKFKWPRLAELHKYLFGSEPPDQHRADGDVAATERCFRELMRRRAHNKGGREQG